MEKWEYLCVYIETAASQIDALNARLNYYSALGWELVCADGQRHYFKRRKV